MVPSRILGSWRVRQNRRRPCRRDVNFFQKNIASLRQNFCVRKRIRNEPGHRDPPSRITQWGSSSSVTYDSSIFLSFIKEFLNHDLISTVPIWSTERPTAKAPQCCRAIIFGVTASLPMGFALSFRLNSHVELPPVVSAASVYFSFIAAVVGHSGLSCGPPPYWHRLSAYSQAQLNQVALRFNHEKDLRFPDPASKLQASVASTV